MTATPDPPEVRRHIPALDGIRALAILLVIPHNIDLLRPPVPLAAMPAAIVMHSGWIGVQLFFVLSGFLITGNLLDTRRSPNYFSVFFGRRALRILPLYFLVLAVAFWVLPALFILPASWRESAVHQIWLWTFLVNWTQPFVGSVTGFTHFWSLAVEEQFYLLWPLVVLKTSPQTLSKICLWIIGGSLALRIMLLSQHAPLDAVYMFTVCRMDALAFGALAAAVARVPNLLARASRSTNVIACVAMGVFLATLMGTSEFAMHDFRTQSVGYTTLSFAFALLILLAALPSSGVLAGSMRLLSWTPLRRIGRYSYGMYVIHLPLHVFVGAPLLSEYVPRLTTTIILSYTLAMIVLTFLLAALSFELFESRFLRMKRLLITQAPAAAVTSR